MLHYFKFRSDLPSPAPARDVYHKRAAGRGWPDECPPLRAANAFGWDVLTAFDMSFKKRRDGTWRLAKEVEIATDWTWEPPGTEHSHAGDHEHGDGCDHGVPLTQRNAWFWEKGQKLPHPISDDVYEQLKNQVKVSTWLFLFTDANELLQISDIPNLARPWRALTAIVDTDWYPASYPWHCVIELDPSQKEIHIPKGTPICRLSTVRRDTYFAREMSQEEFGSFFERGQEWLRRNGKGPPSPMMDITGAYVRQQIRSRFAVI